MFEAYWSFTPPRVDINLPLLDLIIKRARGAREVYGRNIISELTPLIVLEEFLRDVRNIPITPFLLGMGIIMINDQNY